MSYHRTCEPAPAGGPATVTVCTNDLALVDLGEDDGPGAVAEALGNAEGLVGQMVELENQRIALAAVGARMGLEVRDEVCAALRGLRPLATERERGRASRAPTP